MCFWVQDNTVSVATENIEVFKILSVDDCSPFEYFLYDKGETYSVADYNWKLTKADAANYCSQLQHGFHSMRTCTDAIEYKEENVFPSSHKIVRMVIPKGAEYFKNNTQYLSSHLQYPAQEEKSNA